MWLNEVGYWASSTTADADTVDGDVDGDGDGGGDGIMLVGSLIE